MIRNGMQQQANCLEAVVTHTVWNATRASADPQFRKCRRCGAEQETLKHRIWECPVNKLIMFDCASMFFDFLHFFGGVSKLFFELFVVAPYIAVQVVLVKIFF